MTNLKNILITIGISIIVISIIIVFLVIFYESKINTLTQIIKDDIKKNFNELKESNDNVEKKIDNLDKAYNDQFNSITELYDAWFRSRYSN